MGEAGSSPPNGRDGHSQVGCQSPSPAGRTPVEGDGPKEWSLAMRPSNWNVNESIQQTAAQWQLCGFSIPWGEAGIKEVASLPSRSSVEGEVS